MLSLKAIINCAIKKLSTSLSFHHLFSGSALLGLSENVVVTEC